MLKLYSTEDFPLQQLSKFLISRNIFIMDRSERDKFICVGDNLPNDLWNTLSSFGVEIYQYYAYSISN